MLVPSRLQRLDNSMIAPADHRPWPPPKTPWIMFMRWLDLAFLHWPVDPAALQRLLPPQVPLDTFDGKAWLGITPFEMSSSRPRCVPPVPWLSTFPELNVRTYVTIGGKPGIWFLSLDAANAVAVRAARLGFLLPYFDARMSIQRVGETINYRSHRRHSDAPAADFVAQYRPLGDVYHARPETLEYFLVERYVCTWPVKAGCTGGYPPHAVAAAELGSDGGREYHGDRTRD